ncbi:MAG: Hsp20/alpha crystallin family protein [Planctomycetes bacterium]|nr:Hsp20/alpha crystallin family protein [Planctomycetota bacterium]
MARELDSLFGDLLAGFPSFQLAADSARPAIPALNAYEAGDALHIEVELPGFNRDEIAVDLDSNVLTIRAEQKREEKCEDRRYHRRERMATTQVRTLTVPADVDASRIEATVADGVLHLTLPKAESARPRKIDVKTLPSTSEGSRS